MSLIAAFRIETPVLQSALDVVPDMRLQTEDLHALRGEPLRGVFWAGGDNFQAFEAGLETDPTVSEFRVLAAVDDQRLYRVTYTEEGERYLTYPVVAELDVVLLNLSGTHRGLDIRARFPDREALLAYRDACEERGVPFHLKNLYREEEVAGDGDGDRYGVTDAQREALLCALEMGYFDIPRRTTLQEVADELGISSQAVSARLRRGQQNLLRSSLGS